MRPQHALTRHETSGQGARGRRSRRGRRGGARKRLTASSRRWASTLSGSRATRRCAGVPRSRRIGVIIPKTAKGLRDALAPARASVAVDVVGLARAPRGAGGLVAEPGPVAGGRPNPHADLVVVLDGLRSGENVGSVLRTVETAGAGRVICCGTTPAPPTPAVLRAAMGCADLVRVERAPSTLETVSALRRDGFAVWACETTERSVNLFETPPPRPSP